MDSNQRQKIIRALEEREAKLPCSRCGGLQFEVVAQSYISVQENPAMITVGGPSIPTAVVACRKCGHVWQHALASLDLFKGQ